jgi:hypothetical protein
VNQSLADLVSDFAEVLKVADEGRPLGKARKFKPGIGPLTESELTNLVIEEFKKRKQPAYSSCGSRRYPGSRATCDLVLPDLWALEIKLARPFGDNGKPAERWSENLLYPYAGNTSCIGDCIKLSNSEFRERKAVVVVGYEHSPPQILLEPAIRSFELIATSVCHLSLSPREHALITELVHPVHQQAHVYAWEVLRSG